MDKGIGSLILGNIALFVVSLMAIYFGLSVFGIILFVVGVVTMPQLHAILSKPESDLDRAEHMLEHLNELRESIKKYEDNEKEEE